MATLADGEKGLAKALIVISGDYTWQRWPGSDDADYIEHLERHIHRLQECAINALNSCARLRHDEQAHD